MWEVVIGGLLAGAFIVIGTLIATWSGRTSEASRELFVQRIESLNNIVRRFNEMKGLFAHRMEIGTPRWTAEFRVQAGKGLDAFRRAIDDGQVVLDAKVIDAFREIDVLYHGYLMTQDAQPSDFTKALHEALNTSSDAVNESLKKKDAHGQCAFANVRMACLAVRFGGHSDSCSDLWV